MTTPILYIVVPCYNEEEVLPETSKRLLEKLTSLIGRGRVRDESRILFVNDGSRDRTWEMISELAGSDVHFGGVKLSRNRGSSVLSLRDLFSYRKYIPKKMNGIVTVSSMKPYLN